MKWQKLVGSLDFQVLFAERVQFQQVSFAEESKEFRKPTNRCQPMLHGLHVYICNSLQRGSFAKEPYQNRSLQWNRRRNLGSLLIVATPRYIDSKCACVIWVYNYTQVQVYTHKQNNTDTHQHTQYILKCKHICGVYTHKWNNTVHLNVYVYAVIYTHMEKYCTFVIRVYKNVHICRYIHTHGIILYICNKCIYICTYMQVYHNTVHW